MIAALDHLVLTVTDIDRTVDFYGRILGMRRVDFGVGRVALHFGQQKINLHSAAAPISPHAAKPMAGSADLCFLAAKPINEVVNQLRACGVVIEAGPVDRTGAEGPITSVYIRDPDGNLIEISEQKQAG